MRCVAGQRLELQVARAALAGDFRPRAPQTAARWRSLLGCHSVRLAPIAIAAFLAAAAFALAHTPAGNRFPRLHDRLIALQIRLWAQRVPAAGWTLTIVSAVTLLRFVTRYKLIERIHAAFNRQFEPWRRVYGGLLV